MNQANCLIHFVYSSQTLLRGIPSRVFLSNFNGNTGYQAGTPGMKASRSRSLRIKGISKLFRNFDDNIRLRHTTTRQKLPFANKSKGLFQILYVAGEQFTATSAAKAGAAMEVNRAFLLLKSSQQITMLTIEFKTSTVVQGYLRHRSISRNRRNHRRLLHYQFDQLSKN